MKDNTSQNLDEVQYLSKLRWRIILNKTNSKDDTNQNKDEV